MDGSYVWLEMDGTIYYEGYYDASSDIFTLDGLVGEFYAVDDAWYTP